ncbi:MAG: GNAT family N-acetyltransferase [Saprospiraceae bacterium]|nr:GNAT family N-acetyltransferase [Saprospiraceae bacterium]MCF8251183.1 GNAT family N-acetyltransferase [Saprospiraceae bacterium]MCF8282384.1 GNAT family N-acetyltransferase [Bacteroidales bacterium]MCF8312995.1 GNAT family N-acetyltransferase [Saprospiraceae bacterium]MCF8441442.1 GNAT family N-acetyltransferase [Saprospiraceae bacterium]
MLTQQFQFNEVTDTSILNPLKDEWQKSLTAPQDDMWEAFTNYSNHWELKNENQTIGYACVNDDNLLLQFYVLPPWMQESISIFEEFIHHQKIKKALIGTNNPICLSIAMHFLKTIKVDTYLFTDFLNVDTTNNKGILRPAELKDIGTLVIFCHESMGGPKEWLKGYIGNLIKRGEFFILEDGEEILGTCEVRKSESNSKVASVGMVVSPPHRKKGLGTYLLGKAKNIAIQWNKQPICSCEKDNIGSLKSIENNGFRSMHQMLAMEF